jgi:hypothetical protein
VDVCNIKSKGQESSACSYEAKVSTSVRCSAARHRPAISHRLLNASSRGCTVTFKLLFLIDNKSANFC